MVLELVYVAEQLMELLLIVVVMLVVVINHLNHQMNNKIFLVLNDLLIVDVLYFCHMHSLVTLLMMHVGHYLVKSHLIVFFQLILNDNAVVLMVGLHVFERIYVHLTVQQWVLHINHVLNVFEYLVLLLID